MKKTRESKRSITDLLTQKPKELIFCCPECGNSKLRFIQGGIRITMPVYSVDDDGSVEYGDEFDDNFSDQFYACACCDYMLEDDAGNTIETEEDMVEWLRDTCN